jgi:ATP-dependent DNA ligase
MGVRDVNALPAPTTISGGVMFEPKWDGFRLIAFHAAEVGGVYLQSRQHRSLGRYFPEITAAIAEHLPERVVLDGELVCWSPQTRRLDFAALQRRLHPAARQVTELARTHPANYVVFDLLSLGSEDLPAPYRRRRQLLEQLLAQVPAPLALTPATTDPATAAQWFRDWPPAVGVEGLVIKGVDQPYRAERGWLRHRSVGVCLDVDLFSLVS